MDYDDEDDNQNENTGCGCGGCLFVIFYTLTSWFLIWAICFGVRLPQGLFEIDIFPPSVRITK